MLYGAIMATPDDIRKGVNRSEGDTLPIAILFIEILGMSFVVGEFVSVLLGFGSFILLVSFIFINTFTKILLVIGLSLFWARVTLEMAGWEWAIIVFVVSVFMNSFATHIYNHHI
ncbi:hypothetical protein OAK24_00735 [Flavobacteriales bacterium]|nr:hypothetical protein [Flavobacteriales bacterium]